MPFLEEGGLSLRVRLSNSSAALPVNTDLGGRAASVANDILSGEGTDCANMSCGAASRKGFRDNGLGGASKGDREPVDRPGEAARLRKGLLDERLRLSVRPGEGWESKVQTGSSC
jgi:hypothetical protein